MAMDQELPLGLGEFSIATDASSLASLWPPTPLLPPDLHPYQEQESSLSLWRCTQSVKEVRWRLAAAMVELEEAKEEVRRKEQRIAAQVELTRRMAEEVDQLRQQLDQLRQHLLLAATTSSSSDSGASVPTFSPPAANPPTLLEASTAVEYKSTAIAIYTRSMPMAIDDERTTAVLEQLAAKRPLPQQGLLLQAVMEAGPLLENLLVAGPVPQWRNQPPVQPIPSPVISAPSGSHAPMGWGPW